MRKKVGIITLTDQSNYGQKLQNYAVKKILNDFNFDSITFKVKEPKIKKIIYTLNRLFHQQLGITWRWFIPKFKKLVNKDIRIQDKEKFNKIKEFCDKYINYEYTKLPIDGTSHDFFVVGSDQVWNPLFYRADYIRFLRFVNKEKRISLAVSLGVNKIPYYKKRLFKKYISDFEHLSVREYSDAKVIKELTGKEADVLLDPTLCLWEYDWDKISVAVKNKPKEYILTYVLNPYSKCKDFSNKYNLPVINVCDYKDFKKYDIGPSEFLDLIKSASLVVTDSYHGTIFSMIYSTPFVIDNEMINNSRFKSLDKEFDIKNRFIKNVSEDDVFKFNTILINPLMLKTYKFIERALVKK